MVTRVFAKLAVRAKLPAIVGELVAGVALGLLLQRFPDFLSVLWSACQSETYTSLVSLGMFFHSKVVDADVYQRVEQQMSGITRGFLAPIFFVSVGLYLDFSAISQVSGFVAMLVLIAIASKLIGSGLPAYWVGLSKRDSLMVGIGMSGRGAIELIVAGVVVISIW